MENEKTYDVIGIGFGPANIALAIGLEEIENDLEVLFLEKRSKATWQPSMLFPDSDIQNHPLRDLVTPRNPRSKYTFTNFLFEKGRLFEHLNLGMNFPFRIEYEQYVRWVAAYFDHLVAYNTEISSIDLIEDELGNGTGYKLIDNNNNSYYCKQLVIAPGRTPNIPTVFQSAKSDDIIHLNDYLPTISRKFEEGNLNRIAVVGGSQSAIEIMLHANANYPGIQITGFCNPYGYKMKDVSPFTGEVYFPEFAELFYKVDKSTKRRLINDLHHTNYSAADADVLDQLYRVIYQQKITDSQSIFIHRSSNITSVTAAERLNIHFEKVESKEELTEEIDLLILATGFKNFGTQINEESYHSIFHGIKEHMHFDEESCLDVNFDYSVKMKPHVAPYAKCIVNGLCESSHGMGDAGSFSLLSLRAEAIVKALKSGKNIHKEEANKVIFHH